MSSNRSKRKDPPYRPRSTSKKSSSGSMYATRANKNPASTSVAIKRSFFRGLDDQEVNTLAKEINTELNQVEGFRPTSTPKKAKVTRSVPPSTPTKPTTIPAVTSPSVKTVTSSPSTTAPSTPIQQNRHSLITQNTPSQLRETPGKTPMYNLGGWDGIQVFSSEPAPKLLLDIKATLDNKKIRVGGPDFFNRHPETDIVNQAKQINKPDDIELLKKIAPVETKEKIQTFQIDKKTLKKRDRERMLNGTKRNPEQFVAMGDSAGNVAEALQEHFAVIKKGEAVAQKFEWLHMIPYRLIGDAGQNPDNLFLQTDAMNTWMIPNEDAINYLSQSFDKLELTVAVQLKESIVDGKKVFTQMAEGTIKWEIKSNNGFHLKLDIKVPNTATNPHVTFGKFHKIILKAYVEAWKQKHLTPPTALSPSL